jgi:rod shape-determining protein MreD
MLQVLVLNNIRLGGYINPLIYVLFVLMIPFNIKPWLLLLSGFLTGLTIDVFIGTPGLHAGATVFMSFFRQTVIRLTLGHRLPEGNLEPTLYDMGARWFFTYTAIMVVIHHTSLFLLESFSLKQVSAIIIRTLLSSIFTVLMIIIYSFIFNRGGNKT